ncbi:MAG TPA: polysaccharide deacetylase family protein [Thermoanaerobaculia bacterium]|nr:polysaccharide deacetylase family protein [Thermoanaerobaculia bacterium]
MFPRAALLTVALATVGTVAHAAPRSNPSPGATILCYHIVQSPRDTLFSVDRDVFLQQMQYLASSGYNVIPLSDLVDYVTGKRDSIPENSVVITVDDGWRSTYTEIYPVMQRFRFPFTVFVYPKIIERTSYALTWSQIREMADQGVDIESHTFSHAYLTRRKQSHLDAAAYRKWLRTELGGSRELLEEKTGRPVRYLAYPYGDYDDRLAAAVAEHGYEAALTSNFGAVGRGHNPLQLRRVMIFAETGFDSFRRLLGAGSLALTHMTPSPGRELDLQRPVVSARIANPDSIDPSSVRMALPALGTGHAFFDRRDGTVSLVVRDELKGRVQRAVVWGTDRKTGKRVEASWTFYVAADRPPETEVSGIAAKRDTRGR